MVYDSIHDRVVFFGGQRTFTVNPHSAVYQSMDDVWVLTLSPGGGWSEVHPSGAPPDGPACVGAAIAFDSDLDRVIVVGGVLDEAIEVWSLSLGATPAWTKLTPSGTPPITGFAPRRSAVYDGVRDRLVLYGGLGTSARETWTLSFAGNPSGAWSPFAIGGMPDDGEVLLAADLETDRLTIYAGETSSYWTWVLGLADDSEWTATPTGSPVPTGFQPSAMTFDPVGDRALMFSGSSVWEFRFEATPYWSELLPPTDPGPTSGYAAVFDPVRNQMIMVTGPLGMGPGSVVETWYLSLDGTPAWTTPLVSVGDPSAPAFTSLRVMPNPGRLEQTLELALAPGASSGVVEILDLAGRRVWFREFTDVGPGTHRLVWDGRDQAGTAVSPGVYFARIAGSAVTSRLVRID